MISSEDISSKELKVQFDEQEQILRVRYHKIGLMLLLVFCPVGISLDQSIYPDLANTFLFIRIVVTVLAGTAYALHFVILGRRFTMPMVVFMAVVANGYICLMIYLADGVNSPYYGGLIPGLLAIATLLPWKARDTFIVCCATLLMYLAACLGNETPIVGAEASVLQSNAFFLFLIGTVCVLSSHFKYKARFSDFSLRYDLDQKNQALEELDRTKSNFFANVSHELRTPLTLVLGPVQELMDADAALSPHLQKSLVTAHKNALRLLKLIDELLELMRLDQVGQEMRSLPLNLSQFLPEVLQSMRYVGWQKELRFETDGPTDPVVILADADRLERVFSNLLSNAIKFTPRSGCITIRWLVQEDRVLVQVIDDGQGISAEKQKHIFDRFYQVDGSSTRNAQGIGIGLALVKEVTEAHQGTINVESVEGEGTTFSLSFPLCLDVASEEVEESAQARREKASRADDPFHAASQSASRMMAAAEKPMGEELPEVGNLEGPTILVVDDEPDMRSYLIGLLSKEYRILQAGDGDKGVLMALEHVPDLIILDWMMPGKDGLEVCTLLRGEEALKDTRIVMLTARSDEGDKIAGLEAGADDFLHKPFSVAEVEKRVRNHIRSHTLQKNLRVKTVEQQETVVLLQDTLQKLKEAEAQLIQNEKMRAIGVMAAGILHEINNPLNFILAGLNVLKRSVPKDDADVQDILQDVDQGLVRIKDIVSDMQVFAYPERDVEATEFSIRENVEYAVRMTSFKMEGITVETDLENGSAKGFYRKVNQVLINLLQNAENALREVEEERAPRIQIRGVVDEDIYRLTIRDNGTGIAPENIDKVFELFFTTKEVGKGTGNGLAFSYGVIQEHKGSIRVESEWGEYTQFTIELPLIM